VKNARYAAHTARLNFLQTIQKALAVDGRKPVEKKVSKEPERTSIRGFGGAYFKSSYVHSLDPRNTEKFARADLGKILPGTSNDGTSRFATCFCPKDTAPRRDRICLISEAANGMIKAGQTALSLCHSTTIIHDSNPR